MDILLIRTGIPFGYLIVAVAFSIAFLMSLAVAIRSIRSAPVKRLPFALSLTLVAFLSLVLWANLSQDDIDLNPLIVGNEPLIGDWQNGDSKLTLLNDGRYSCSGTFCDAINVDGHWQRYKDFEIGLTSTAGTAVRWRITKNISKSSYQLIAGAVGDPDIWETHVTFEKAINP